MEALKLILEKIKSGMLSIDEGITLIKALFSWKSDKKEETNNKETANNCGNKQEGFEERIDESIRKIFSTVMSEENKDEILRFKGKLEKDLKDSLRDWVNH